MFHSPIMRINIVSSELIFRGHMRILTFYMEYRCEDATWNTQLYKAESL